MVPWSVREPVVFSLRLRSWGRRVQWPGGKRLGLQNSSLVVIGGVGSGNADVAVSAVMTKSRKNSLYNSLK
jgi:hypothetical protein